MDKPDQLPQSSTDKPIIAVCGATGCQGGSLAKHLLQDELSRAGATITYASFDDLDSLCSAFEGCYGAYGMTYYYEAFEKETQQGINIVKAAKAAQLKHLVFSGQSLSLTAGVPHTTFMTAFYFGNVFLFDAITKSDTGGWKLSFPFPTDIPVPSVSPKDIGTYILAALNDPSEWLGQDICVANEYLTPRQYATIFAEVTSANMQIYETSREQFMALEHAPFIINEWSTFKWFIDDYESGQRTMTELAAKLCPTKQSWRDFVIERMEAPAPQPLAIECLLTQDQFRHH